MSNSCVNSSASSTRLCTLARPRSFTGRLIGFVVVLFLLHPPIVSEGQEGSAESPKKVEAAFLRNFAHYVVWPPDAFADPGSPWSIGVLGRDPFGEVLEKTLQDRREQGRSFNVYRAETLDRLPACHIIFITYHDSGRLRTVLEKLKSKPVLTVGDAPQFLLDGGIIRFRLRDRVLMSINLDRARAVSLKIQTKMLEVADEVVENGIVRKVR